MPNALVETAMANIQPTGPAVMHSTDQQNGFVDNLNRREIPSLNGLRGVAALAVVIWHYLDRWKLSYLYPGPFAVTLFFELSGLLITWLLLKEQESTGHVDKPLFYSRRALRLFPVFYLVWILCRLIGPFAGDWAFLFYMGDYYTAISHRYSVLTAAWSLGVEEKFYLLWPFVMTSLTRKNLMKVLVGVLICEPVYRHILTAFGHREYTWFAFDSRLDPVVLGCLVAVAAKGGWRPPRWLSHPLTPLIALVGVFLAQTYSDVVTYLLAIILVSVICRPPALLNNRVVRYLGLISYSLYLCHGYAELTMGPHITRLLHSDSVWALLPIEVLIAIGFASALHFGVERPFLKLKSHLHARPSTAV